MGKNRFARHNRATARKTRSQWSPTKGCPGNADSSARELGFRSYREYLTSDMARTVATKVLGHITHCKACRTEDQPTKLFNSYFSSRVLAGNDTGGTSLICERCFRKLEYIRSERGHSAACHELKSMVALKKQVREQANSECEACFEKATRSHEADGRRVCFRCSQLPDVKPAVSQKLSYCMAAIQG